MLPAQLHARAAPRQALHWCRERERQRLLEEQLRSHFTIARSALGSSPSAYRITSARALVRRIAGAVAALEAVGGEPLHLDDEPQKPKR